MCFNLAVVLILGVIILSVDPDLLFRPADLEGLGAGVGSSEETWALSAELGLLRRLESLGGIGFSGETGLLFAEPGLLLELAGMGSRKGEVSCKVAALSFRDGEELLLAVAGLKVRLSGRGFFDEGKFWTGFALCSLSLVPVGGRPETDFFLEFAPCRMMFLLRSSRTCPS